jgi:cell division protein FtsN
VQPDVPGDTIVHITTAAPPAPPSGSDLTTFLRSRRQMRQQQTTFALLLAAVLALVIAGLVLAIGSSGSSQPSTNKPATAGAKKTPAPRPRIETPEELEAREGIQSLEPAKPRRHKPILDEPNQQ